MRFRMPVSAAFSERVMKVSSGFQCRSDEEIERIDELLKSNNRKHRGIAPRNRAKLRKFKDKQIQMGTVRWLSG